MRPVFGTCAPQVSGSQTTAERTRSGKAASRISYIGTVRRRSCTRRAEAIGAARHLVGRGGGAFDGFIFPNARSLAVLRANFSSSRQVPVVRPICLLGFALGSGLVTVF